MMELSGAGVDQSALSHLLLLQRLECQTRCNLMPGVGISVNGKVREHRRTFDLPVQPFIKRIEKAIGLSLNDRETLLRLRVSSAPSAIANLSFAMAEVASQCTVVLQGFLALSRYKVVGDREQILSIHVPGDFPDLQTLYLPRIDHDLISIDPFAHRYGFS